MVVKPDNRVFYTHEFESSVDSYGSQTPCLLSRNKFLFESSVDSYGSQTVALDNTLTTRLRVV